MQDDDLGSDGDTPAPRRRRGGQRQRGGGGINGAAAMAAAARLAAAMAGAEGGEGESEDEEEEAWRAAGMRVGGPEDSMGDEEDDEDALGDSDDEVGCYSYIIALEGLRVVMVVCHAAGWALREGDTGPGRKQGSGRAGVRLRMCWLLMVRHTFV